MSSRKKELNLCCFFLNKENPVRQGVSSKTERKGGSDYYSY
jgi:hypothetical protein